MVLKEGLITWMDVVEARFRKNEIFIPKFLVGAKSIPGGMEVLRSKLGEGEIRLAGKIVLGTAQGNLHDIRKNLVGMMMGGAGF